MEAKIGKFFESASTFFAGNDQIPWCDRDIIAGCEQEVVEAQRGSSDDFKNECIMRLSWALVHSRQPEDIHRGMAILECKRILTKSSLSHAHICTEYKIFVFITWFLYYGFVATVLIGLATIFAASLGSTTSRLKLRGKLCLLAVVFIAWILYYGILYYGFIATVLIGLAAIFAASLGSTTSPRKLRGKLYLLAVVFIAWILYYGFIATVLIGLATIFAACLGSTTSPLKLREKLYLLAVGYYRTGDYSKSRELVEKCLEIEPEWRQAQTLKRAIEDQIRKDVLIGIGLAATAAGLVAGGIAAALRRKK